MTRFLLNYEMDLNNNRSLLANKTGLICKPHQIRLIEYFMSVILFNDGKIDIFRRFISNKGSVNL